MRRCDNIPGVCCRVTQEFDPPPAPQQAVALHARVLALSAPVATCDLEHAIALAEQPPLAMERSAENIWQATVPSESLEAGARERMLLHQHTHHAPLRSTAVHPHAMGYDHPPTRRHAAAGSLLQWRVVCADTEGRASVSPHPVAPDDVRWHGTMVSGLATNTTLPVLHWFTRDEAAAMSPNGLQVRCTSSPG